MNADLPSRPHYSLFEDVQGLLAASVQAALRLYEKGFRFIGVIKQSTTNYPKKYLGEVMLPVRGASAARSGRRRRSAGPCPG